MATSCSCWLPRSLPLFFADLFRRSLFVKSESEIFVNPELIRLFDSEPEELAPVATFDRTRKSDCGTR